MLKIANVSDLIERQRYKLLSGTHSSEWYGSSLRETQQIHNPIKSKTLEKLQSVHLACYERSNVQFGTAYSCNIWTLKTTSFSYCRIMNKALTNCW